MCRKLRETHLSQLALIAGRASRFPFEDSEPWGPKLSAIFVVVSATWEGFEVAENVN